MGRDKKKILYLDCGMGAAGDMLTAALLELLPAEERAGFVAELNALGIPGVTFTAEPAVRCGVQGAHMSVKVHGEDEFDLMDGHIHSHDHDHGHESHHHDSGHEHGSMHSIEHILEHTAVSEKIRSDVMAVYAVIADAESRVHGVPVSEIHFHEVGTIDAVADVTAVCMLMDRTGADCITASPVNTGSGTVRCAHGVLPVPAPATALILEGIPNYKGEIKSELCTPTGAALLKHFVSDFGDMPEMKIVAEGHGMGNKDFEQAANCVRALLGETE